MGDLDPELLGPLCSRRLRPDGVLGRQDGLAEGEGAEGENLADHHGHRSEHDDLGAEYHRTAGNGRQRGADGARSVFGAHDQHTQDPEYELPEEDADQAPAGGIVDEVGGAHRAGAQSAQSHHGHGRAHQRPRRRADRPQLGPLRGHGSAQTDMARRLVGGERGQRPEIRGHEPPRNSTASSVNSMKASSSEAIGVSSWRAIPSEAARSPTSEAARPVTFIDPS